MYACIYVCMHACMQTCMHVCMHVCTDVGMCVCMFALVCVHACMYVGMHVCICMYYVYVGVCLGVCARPQVDGTSKQPD